MNIFKYTDADGRPQVEVLDAQQSADDVQVLRDFESIESNATLGEAEFSRLLATGIFSQVVEACVKRIATLPPARAAHWRAEFSRLGFDAAAKESAAEKEAAESLTREPLMPTTPPAEAPAADPKAESAAPGAGRRPGRR